MIAIAPLGESFFYTRSNWVLYLTNRIWSCLIHELWIFNLIEKYDEEEEKHFIAITMMGLLVAQYFFNLFFNLNQFSIILHISINLS